MVMEDRKISVEEYNFEVLQEYITTNYNVLISFISFGSLLDEYYDGITMRKKISDKCLIHIKKNMIPTRQNFTLCHELSHYIWDFKLGDRIGGFQSFSSKTEPSETKPIEEWMADASAGVFMIPDACLKYCIDNDYSFNQIMRKYKISKQALKMRLLQVSEYYGNAPLHLSLSWYQDFLSGDSFGFKFLFTHDTFAVEGKMKELLSK